MTGALNISAASKKKVKTVPSPITIGTIVYNLDDIDAQFQGLHEAGFKSCQLNWNASKMTRSLPQR